MSSTATHDSNPEKAMDPKTNPPDKLQQIKDAALTLLPRDVRPEDAVVTYKMPWVSAPKVWEDGAQRVARVRWTCRVTVADINAAPRWEPEKLEADLIVHGDSCPSNDECLGALLDVARARVAAERRALLERADAMGLVVAS